MALVVGLLLNWYPAGSGALSAEAREIACRVGGAVAPPLTLSALLSAFRLSMMCFLQRQPYFFNTAVLAGMPWANLGLRVAQVQ